MSLKASEYSLSWEGHIQHVRKAFNRLLQSNELCDVTLYAEGQKIRAHKVVLSACSKYFDQLFKDFKDERPVVVLKGVQFNALKNILSFVYNGEANVEVDELTQFLEAASFLKIDGLTENHLKRKRKHSLSEPRDNTNKIIEENDTSNVFADMVEKEQYLSGSPLKESFKTSTKSIKPPKLYRRKNSPDKTQDDHSNITNYLNFAKTPEICKYSMDSPTRVGDWLSDYELTSQSSVVESQSSLNENVDILLHDNNTNDSPINIDTDKSNNRNVTSIKTEPHSGTIESDSDIEEISSFNQNDFANSLDAEIEISDSGDNDMLEKQLLKSSLASIDEKGLYLCKICNKSYVKKDSLKKHFAVHVNNTKCMICGRVLSRKTHLIRHLKMHGISSK